MTCRCHASEVDVKKKSGMFRTRGVGAYRVAAMEASAAAAATVCRRCDCGGGGSAECIMWSISDSVRMDMGSYGSGECVC